MILIIILNYDDDLLAVDTGVFEELVEAYIPSMSSQMQHLSMMSLISLSWFLTIFLRSVHCPLLGQKLLKFL